MNAKMMVRGFCVVACVSWALFPSVTRAQDEQPSVPPNHVTFGGQWWDQTRPEAKFQEFREFPRGGFIENWYVGGEAGRRSWEFSGANALRGDETARFRWSNGIRYKIRANYTQTPHNFSFITRSPYDLVNRGGGVYAFVLPDSFQWSNQTLLNVSGSAGTAANAAYNARISDLLRASPLMPIGFRTDVAKASVSMRPAKGLQVDLTGEKRDRNGSKPWSAAFGFSGAMEVWEPINQRTVDGEAALTYTGKNYVVRADGGINTFTNNASTLQWDNPRRLTSSAAGNNAGAGFGQMDLYPDNKMVRGNLGIGVTLPQQTVLTLNAGLARTTQDDPFLPFTVNQAVIDTAAKYPSTPLGFLDHNGNLDTTITSLKGKADVIKVNGKITTHAVDMVAFTARADYYKYDNKTPAYEYGASVAYDQSYQKGPFETDPWGNSRTVIGADIDVSPTSEVELGGTVEYRGRDRTYREIDKDGEMVFIGEAEVHPVPRMRVSGSYQIGDRKPKDPVLIEDYENANGQFIEQPNLRRLDVGQRMQTKAKGALSWMANEMVDFSAMYDYTKNDFVKDSLDAKNALEESYGPQLGLRLQKGNNIIGTASVHPSPMVDLTAGYGHGKMESDMFSRETPTAPPPLRQDDSLTWSIHTTEKNDLAFANVVVWPVVNKVSFSVGYEYDNASTSFGIHKGWERVDPDGSGPGVPILVPQPDTINVPNITYRRHDIQLQVTVRAMHDTDVGLRYGRQIYKASDFSADNTPVVFASSDQSLASTGIYLGDRIQNYLATSAALIVTRRF